MECLDCDREFETVSSVLLVDDGLKLFHRNVENTSLGYYRRGNELYENCTQREMAGSIQLGLELILDRGYFAWPLELI